MTGDATRPKLSVDKVVDGQVVCLKLAGTIDEQFEGKKLATGLKGGALVLDLGDIERISSFGIREWVDFIGAAAARVDTLWFVECAPKVVDQFNMVANFGGDGHIVSFYAPYRCDYCDDDRRRLVQVTEEWEALRAGKLAERVCAACGNAEYFDEDPLTFLSFLQSRPPLTPPAEVGAFLSRRLHYSEGAGARKLKIEKQIDGRMTYLRLSGDLDASLPRDKLADGLEGEVVFDLAGVGKIDPAGAAEWRQLMAQIAPVSSPVERILLVGCPATFVERLTRPGDLGQKAVLLSFAMPYSCPTCRATSARELDAAEHYELLKFATPPELRCPDCGGPSECAASEALVAHLPSLPRPNVDAETRRKLERFRAQALAQALAHKAGAAPHLPPLTLPVAPSAPRGLPWTTALLAAAVALVAVLGVVVGRGLLEARRAGGEKLEASQPTRPAWVEQTFYRDGDRLLFVGHASAADKGDAFADAEAGALEEVANQIGLSVRDPEWIDRVRSQFEAFRHKAIGDLERATVAGEAAELERARLAVRDGKRRVAAALRKTGGGLVPAERNDLYWEQLRQRDGLRYQVAIRYAVPKATFEQLVDWYLTPASALGARAVPLFPGLAWRYDVSEGAVVTHVANDSPLRFAGVQEGDVVLAGGMDRVVHDARSFRRVLDEEAAALAPRGGTLVVRVKRGDAPAVEARVRVPAAGAQGAARARPPRNGQPRARNQTGNIWDDNPDE